MPLSPYQQALADLASGADVIENAFETWRSNPQLDQVRQNVSAETALSAAAFLSLLTLFAEKLAAGDQPQPAWISSCRHHQLHGAIVSDANCPRVLGRARSLDDHADAISKSSYRAFSSDEARRLLLQHSGATESIPSEFAASLYEAALGNYVVWATFHPDNPSGDPFDGLPRTHPGICCALGLGHFTTTDILLILIWDHTPSSTPLRRPTVADAGDFEFYRPRPDPHAHWGLTQPLAPNPSRLSPRPEIVMPPTASAGLRLPFWVIQV